MFCNIAQYPPYHKPYHTVSYIISYIISYHTELPPDAALSSPCSSSIIKTLLFHAEVQTASSCPVVHIAVLPILNRDNRSTSFIYYGFKVNLTNSPSLFLCLALAHKCVRFKDHWPFVLQSVQIIWHCRNRTTALAQGWARGWTLQLGSVPFQNNHFSRWTKVKGRTPFTTNLLTTTIQHLRRSISWTKHRNSLLHVWGVILGGPTDIVLR